MHASGIGKALLSYKSPERLRRNYLRKKLERFTQNTITDPEQLLLELKRTRDAGYAIDDEERELGMRCIAAPILDSFGETVAGISVSGPTHRMGPERLINIGTQVRRAAEQLSQEMGAIVE